VVDGNDGEGLMYEGYGGVEAGLGMMYVLLSSHLSETLDEVECPLEVVANGVVLYVFVGSTSFL